MPVEVVLPRVDMAMDKGSILAWKVKAGDSVRTGDLLFEMNTDKATMEVESPATGTIDEIAAMEGVEVPVGTVVARIFKPGEDRSPDGKAQPAADRPETQPVDDPVASSMHDQQVAPAADARAAAPSGQSPQDASPSPRLRLTPLARRLARENKIDPLSLRGSGPKGRIEGRDIVTAVTLNRADRAEVSLLQHRPAAEQTDQRSDSGIRTASGETAGLFYRQWLPRVAERAATALLLHGFGGNSLSFDPTARALAQAGMKVIAPDLPGHGRSTTEAADMSAVVSGLISFCETMITDRVSIVGHSLGAICATRLAGLLGLDVARLVLLAPAGIGLSIDGAFVAGMAEAATPGAVSHLLRRLTVRSVDYSQAQLDAMAADLGRGRLTALAGNFVRGSTQAIDIVTELERLAVPTHVLVGINDAVIPWAQVENLPARVAVHIVRAAGHMLHWDQPRIVADLLQLILHPH